MYKRIIVSFFLVLGLSCSNNREEKIIDAPDSDSLKEAIVLDTIQHNDSIAGDNNGEFQLYYIVSADESLDYSSLRFTAIEVMKKLNFKFDSLGRFYSRQKKRMILPCDSPDELYACDYLLRRHGVDFVSIEMRNEYPDVFLKENENEFFNTDTLKMYVCVCISDEKRQADSLLGILKPNFPRAKIIANRMFMGCMH